METASPSAMLVAYVASNIIALLMAYFSWKKSVIARILYFILFVWASWANAVTAIKTPNMYLEYSKEAVLPFYKTFILGFFSEHITFIVIAIAVCQLAIGVSMLLKGWIFKLGALGGLVFLIAITPLGFYSAAPAPFIMAIGLFILLRKQIDQYVWYPFQSLVPYIADLEDDQEESYPEKVIPINKPRLRNG